jgi:hypothetical protein
MILLKCPPQATTKRFSLGVNVNDQRLSGYAIDDTPVSLADCWLLPSSMMVFAVLCFAFMDSRKLACPKSPLNARVF